MPVAGDWSMLCPVLLGGISISSFHSGEMEVAGSCRSGMSEAGASRTQTPSYCTLLPPRLCH